MSNNNNLNELNSILFDTLRGVKEGNVDTKRAQSVIGLSNALINNAKVQLNAAKLAGARSAPGFFALTEGPTPEPGTPRPTGRDKHELMNHYAKEVLGHNNVSDAMDKVGKDKFKQDFEAWVNS